VIIGTLLPFTPIVAPLGFTPLPLAFLLFLAVATVTYVGMVELVKRRLMPQMMFQHKQGVTHRT
jgi:Mg2+-importing ATPase